MSKASDNAKVDELKEAVRNRDGAKAAKIVEEIGNSNPKAARDFLAGRWGK
jgi:uncharacterized membrane protein YvbJ